ncbi:MAG: hypothetical protein ACI9MC_003785 [Kiritimatiellia bacterium]|jgi:hypothetical protein
MFRVLSCVLLLATVACDADGDGLSNQFEKKMGIDAHNTDTDGDGLSDAEELDWGSDPLLPDTDGDGLNDRAEFEHGTDPNNVDTDGDAYWDTWEVTEGTDPLDADDRIYEGGWPYQPNKDDWTAEADEHREAGGALPRWTFQDHHGDELDLYDFAGSGDDLMLIFATSWCGPSHSLADRVNEAGGCVAEAIRTGKLRVITVLTEGDRAPATARDLEKWDDSHHNPHVPVVMDPDNHLGTWGQIRSFPDSTHIDLTTMTVGGKITNGDYAGKWIETHCED